ncbi:MAG: M23 family metallopeptidase [Clostridia bacterium]|nr:M23 family metallopeptidase [Clostridia bacterium]
MIFITLKLKKILIAALIIGITVIAAFFYAFPHIKLHKIAKKELSIMEKLPLSTSVEAEYSNSNVAEENSEGSEDQDKKYIKWIDFKVCYPAMEKALSLDIKSHNTEHPLNWIELLSYLSAKYGGEFSRYKEKDLAELVNKLKSGSTMQELTCDMKYYNYYLEAYGAILGQFVGEYSVEVENKNNPEEPIWEQRYGLKVFSPIARGYSFSDFDDFGTKRSYGYKRKHLGHDLMGSVGTPVIAVESGIVEALGWNQYGGWRIGIRSFDQKRYYYYAHLRKNHPYNSNIKEGSIVKAGDVIGYLGMTGYSVKENVNNIDTPHLHLGLQIIFDESQKDGINQIWIDLYDIVKLLQKNKSAVYYDPKSKDFFRKYDFSERLLQMQD